MTTLPEARSSKCLHDQTVRLMNRGYKPAEIAETLALPASLASDLVTCVATTGRSPNARAIDQRDIGWYDAG